MIGGLVEQEHVGLLHQGLRQGDTLFHAARQLLDGQVCRQVQPLQGGLHALLPIPAVLGLDAGHERVQVFAFATTLQARHELTHAGEPFSHGLGDG